MYVSKAPVLPYHPLCILKGEQFKPIGMPGPTTAPSSWMASAACESEVVAKLSPRKKIKSQHQVLSRGESVAKTYSIQDVQCGMIQEFATPHLTDS